MYGYVKKSARKSGTQLLQASNLRTLTLAHGEVCQLRRRWDWDGTAFTNVSTNMIMQDFGKILAPLKASYEAQNLKANVLDLINLADLPSCKEWILQSNEDRI
ncbi:hypothetical protein AC578_10506 [Pseudocercospora eumusae]|uniref:Uncharacterized protein n=1 Tax=Pseudocercospora eumusae TaxID=321146 RepID=A0A139H8F6_9PEZI|nr:hypothetical protein AC578_10506 [Pseudocercospora eumusae]